MNNKKLSKRFLTWYETKKLVTYHNSINKVVRQFGDVEPILIYIRFKQMSEWKRQYTEIERTYVCRSDNKFFLPNMLGTSLFADCLAGDDTNVRLDWYLGDWIIEEIYIVDRRYQ